MVVKVIEQEQVLIQNNTKIIGIRYLGRKEPVVKEPQNPEDGEYSLDQFGEQVQFKDGKWQRSIFP